MRSGLFPMRCLIKRSQLCSWSRHLTKDRSYGTTWRISPRTEGCKTSLGLVTTELLPGRQTSSERSVELGSSMALVTESKPPLPRTDSVAARSPCGSFLIVFRIRQVQVCIRTSLDGPGIRASIFRLQQESRTYN